MSSGIIKSSHRKNSLYRDYLKSKQGKNSPLYEKFKKYKNKLTALICVAEKSHYHNKFDFAKHSIKKTWQIIKTIVNGEYNKKETVNEISVEGVKITDKN